MARPNPQFLPGSLSQPSRPEKKGPPRTPPRPQKSPFPSLHTLRDVWTAHSLCEVVLCHELDVCGTPQGADGKAEAEVQLRPIEEDADALALVLLQQSGYLQDAVASDKH